MANNTYLSSSEQYVKRSNRLWLILGIGLLIAFLSIMLLTFRGEKKVVEEPNIPFPESPNPFLDKTPQEGIDLGGEEDGSIRLIATPEKIEMNSVVVGGSAEAILTLKAVNGSIHLVDLNFAEAQQDGFALDGSCTSDMVLEKDASCNAKILWNPVSVRMLQNNLNIVWKVEDLTSYTPASEKTLTISVSGQSTDSKDCVICEDKTAEALAKKAQGVLLEDTNMYVDPVTGELVGIIQPEKIAIGLRGKVIGQIVKDTNEVVDEDGNVLGRLLPDDTIVTKDLKVLGAALPLLPVLNGEGKVIGRLLKDGTVVDPNERFLGLPFADGTIINKDGVIIGSVMPWGLVLNLSSKAVGATQEDGSVMNVEKQKIGTILPGGLMVNATGEISGGLVPRGLAIGSGCHSFGKVSQNGKIINDFGQQIGYVTTDGLVLDMSSLPVGMVVREGVIIDAKGTVIAFVNSEGKAVTATKDLLGCLSPDGTVFAGKEFKGAVLPRGRVMGYDLQIKGITLPNGSVIRPSSGESLGYVLTTGYVADLNEKTIGAVVPKGIAVAQGCLFLGVIDLNGNVLDREGKIVGVVTPDKKVVNKARDIIGGVAPMGAVVGPDGKFLGFVRPDGKVVDRSGKVIGCVNPDGTVVNEDGVIIGMVSKIGTVLDANGNPTGWTVIGNKVYNENGDLIGTLVDGMVVNENGEIIGFIPPDGIVVSPTGELLGRFTNKIGYVVNAKGENIGRVLPDLTAVQIETSEIIGALIADGTQIINISSERIGSVQGDGSVVDLSGNEIGVIRANGTVISREGIILGGAMPKGNVLDWTSNIIGTVQDSGKVLSSDKKELGTVTLSRTVINSNGDVIGLVFPEPSIPLGEKGEVLGFLTINGTINKDGKPVGRVTAAGNIFNMSNRAIGSLVRLGSVMGTDRQVKGWLAFDGNLMSKKQEPIGRVMPDGYAVDEKGFQIGHIIPRRTVVDLKGNFVGAASVDGRVLGKTGQALGFFPYHSQLIDEKDLWIGRSLPAGVALDEVGKVMGQVRFDGSVVNNRGQVLGTIRSDNRIMNAEQKVVGLYVPYGEWFFDQKGKVLGAMSFDGQVRDSKGSIIGSVIGSTLVDVNNNIVGRMMPQGFATDEQGKVTGHIFPNATTYRTLEDTDEEKADILTSSYRIVNEDRQIVGGAVPFGLMLSLDGKVRGNAAADASVLSNNAPMGKILPDSIVYDTQDRVSGGLIAPNVIVDRDGHIVGSTSVSNVVLGTDGKKAATLMPFGSALTNSNQLFGLRMLTGGAVDDFARKVGFVSVDGRVVLADGTMTGRVMQDGTVVRLLNPDSFGVMPDFADVIAEGVAIGLKPELYGRAMPTGDILNTANEKIADILDDATLLDKNGKLAGALVGYRTAIDHKANVLGNSTGDGQVTDITGKKVGPLASNGAIKGSHQLKTLGAVVPDNLVSNMCKIVGQVRYDGRVVNQAGEVVASINLDGSAISLKGEPLGGVVQKGSVIANDEKGTLLGRTLPDSDVVDLNGVSIGCALFDGTVIDHNGNVIGRVLKRGIVVDENGNVIGRVLRNGDVVDENGKVIGHVLSDGTVVDPNGKVIGHVVDLKKNHLLFDDAGNIMGSMDKAGKVFDNKGKHLFTVDPDGKLYDPKGNLIGYVDDEGKIHDLKGNVIGDATHLPKYLYDENDNIIGYVDDEGKIHDLTGEEIGYIDENGDIIIDGKKWGSLNPDGSINREGEDQCTNAKYNGEVYDNDGNLLYKIKCGKIYDKNGNLIGYIDENGRMYDLDGNYMGRIDEDGNVYDKDGNLIGKWRPSSGTKDEECLHAQYNGEVKDNRGNLLYKIKCGKIYDKNGNLIGYIDENGNMYDLNGNYMGRIDENGNVYDKDGNLIGKWRPTVADDECQHAQYNGQVRDFQGELLYTIKCGKIYDKNGNLIGYIDGDGKMYDLNGNYMGRIDGNGNVYDKNNRLIGRWEPERGAYLAGASNLLAGSNIRPGMRFGLSDLNGRKISIADRDFIVNAKGEIIDPRTGALVGLMKGGVPYSLSDNKLVDEIGPSKFPGQDQIVPSPEQIDQMQRILSQKRASMRAGVKTPLAASKIMPDARILARSQPKQTKDFGSKKVSTWPVDMSRMILKDKAIPAVLVRSIDSRYMSVPASAIVERNVYAEDGRNILIPAGSKIIGRVSGSPGANHVAKLEISWERIIRPDGGAFTLSGAVSGDAQGRGGVAAYLDEQWLNKYGRPLLQSSLTSAVSYLISVDQTVTENADTGTKSQSDRADAAQEARENFVNTMQTIFNQMIAEASTIPPVLFVPSGTRLTIFAMEDLYLRSEQDDVDEYEEEYGPDTKQAKVPSGNYGLSQRPLVGADASMATVPAEEGEYYDPTYIDEQPIYSGNAEVYQPEEEQYEEPQPQPQPQQQQVPAKPKDEGKIATPLKVRGGTPVQKKNKSLY